jgi:opacity protein-like surface antigen
LKPESFCSFAFPLLFTASVLLLGAAPARAQSIAEARTWTVTPFIHTSLGVSPPAPNDSIGLGGALAYDLTENLGFEGEISHLFDVDNTAQVDWSITNLSINGVYHFDVLRVTPYATFGMGMERSRRTVRDPTTDDLSLVADPSATEVAINFGGGVKYLLSERFMARGDLRRFQANDDAPNYWRLYGGVTFFVRR